MDLAVDVVQFGLRFFRNFRPQCLAGGHPHERDIQAGQVVALVFGSANSDPAVFTEPEQCRLDRSPNPHLTFAGDYSLE